MLNMILANCCFRAGLNTEITLYFLQEMGCTPEPLFRSAYEKQKIQRDLIYIGILKEIKILMFFLFLIQYF